MRRPRRRDYDSLFMIGKTPIAESRKSCVNDPWLEHDARRIAVFILQHCHTEGGESLADTTRGNYLPGDDHILLLSDDSSVFQTV
jgi:hypothetical protein